MNPFLKTYTIRITERESDERFAPLSYKRSYISEGVTEALSQCINATEREYELKGYITISKDDGDPGRLVMMKDGREVHIYIEPDSMSCIVKGQSAEQKESLKKRVATDIAIVGLGLFSLLLIFWVGLDMHLPVQAAERCFIRDGVHTAAYVIEEIEQETVEPETWEQETSAPVYETPAPDTAAAVPETSAPAPAEETVNAQIDDVNADTDVQDVETASNALNLSEYDEYLLLNIMMHEAGNQGPIGCALVGRCVINRMQDPAGRFGNSIEAVLTQPHQFGPLSEICKYTPNADCYTALEMLESGWDDSQGALFFESGAGFSWATFLFQYGGHRFYTA